MNADDADKRGFSRIRIGWFLSVKICVHPCRAIAYSFDAG